MVFTSLSAACNFSASSNFQLSDDILSNETPFMNTNSLNFPRPNMSYNADFQLLGSHYNDTTDNISNKANSSIDVNYDQNNYQHFSFSSNILGNWNTKRSNYFSYKLNDMKQFYNQEIPLMENSNVAYNDSEYYPSANLVNNDIDSTNSCNMFPPCMNINLSMKMNVDLEAAYTRHNRYPSRNYITQFCQNYPLPPIDIYKASHPKKRNAVDPFPYSLSHNQYSDNEINAQLNSNSATVIDERVMSQIYNYGQFNNYQIRIHPLPHTTVPILKYQNSENLCKEGNHKDLKLISTHFHLYEPNQCHLCSRSYARPSTLKIHMRTHSGERPFKCIVCSKTFSQLANLTAHKRIHSGEKPFSCHICFRTFSQSSSVTTHMRTHSGERPYRCHRCSKAFSDSSTLTKHTRVHSGEKPYKCRICLLKFSQSGNLNRHMRVHLNSITSSCES